MTKIRDNKTRPARPAMAFGPSSSSANDKPIHAYVLVQTTPGRVEAIARSLSRMPAMQSVYTVTGPYDIVALLGVDDLREVSQLVAGSIGGMRGVTRTTTLICA